MTDSIFEGFPRYYVRMVHEFWEHSPCGESRLVRNTTWIFKRGMRWDEVRSYGHFPVQSRLRTLSEAKRAATSAYIRAYRGKAHVEIVRTTRDGDVHVVWRDPALSALEQLALVAP